jgi:flagellin
MRINHNVAALNTHRQMGINSDATQKSLEKLSSGLSINRAGDNAAGLAISEKMRGQIRGLDQAGKNSQDGISLIQTGEGALNETQSILQRMRELAVQSGTDTNTATDRTNIQSEVTALTSEVDRIANTTEFNTKKLLDGSLGRAVTTAVANQNTNTSLKNSVGSVLLAATIVSDMTDSNGNNLGIISGDTIAINYQVNGTTYSVSIRVGTGTTDIASILAAITAGNALVSTTINSTGGIQINAEAVSSLGFSNAVNGITVSVKDASGVLRSAASTALSSFTQTRAASDAKLSDGTATFQIGANAGQTIGLNISQMDSSGLGVANLKVTSQPEANVAIKSLDAALQSVSSQRANLGAVQNRLEHTIANLATSAENLQSSESRIRDVDMAKEMMEFTKNNILSQASQAMLAQANQQPQGVLSLLR